MKTQCDRLAKLLERSQGATAFEICKVVGSTSPHRRLTDMKNRGWSIRKVPVPGEAYHRYVGVPPTGVAKMSV